MADEFAEDGIDQGDLDDDALADDITPEPEGDTPPPPAPGGDDEHVPEKLKGKTPAELVKMLADREATITRQGEELGEFRRKPAEPAHEETAADPRQAIYDAAAEELADWETEKRLDLQVQGYSAEDADTTLGALRQAKFDLLYKKASREQAKVEKERIARYQEQAPTLVAQVARDVLAGMPNAGVTAEEVAQTMLAEPNAAAQLAQASPAQRRNIVQAAAIYTRGLQAMRGDGVPIHTDGETPRTPSVLRRNTTTPKPAPESHPEYKALFDQQKAMNPQIDARTAEGKARIDKQVKYMLAQRGGK